MFEWFIEVILILVILVQYYFSKKRAEHAWAIISRPSANGRQGVPRPSSLLTTETETEKKIDNYRERA